MDLIQLQMEEKRLLIKKAALEIELLENRLKVRTCLNINLLHVKSGLSVCLCLSLYVCMYVCVKQFKKKNILMNFTFIVFQEMKK